MITAETVVRARLLVGGDEVGIVDGRKGHHVLHVGGELPLQVVLQHAGAHHRLNESPRNSIEKVWYRSNKCGIDQISVKSMLIIQKELSY